MEFFLLEVCFIVTGNKTGNPGCKTGLLIDEILDETKCGCRKQNPGVVLTDGERGVLVGCWLL